MGLIAADALRRHDVPPQHAGLRGPCFAAGHVSMNDAMTQQDPGQSPFHGRTLRAATRPAGGNPDPVDAPFALEQLSRLGHDLNNLLDGSMRCLSLARRALCRDESSEKQIDDARRRIEVAYTALERMADLVHAAMKGSSSVVGSPNLSPTRPITLEDAISHAAEVVGPEADERGIEIEISIAPEVASAPAGPVYSVILHGLRNSIESIARACSAPGADAIGAITVTASLKPVSASDDPGIDLILIEVIDDGRGFVAPGDPNQAFDLGFTTKPGSLGIGLALSREVIREIGGMIELAHPEAHRSRPRPGAILRVAYPVPRDKPREGKS